MRPLGNSRVARLLTVVVASHESAHASLPAHSLTEQEELELEKLSENIAAYFKKANGSVNGSPQGICICHNLMLPR